MTAAKQLTQEELFALGVLLHNGPRLAQRTVFTHAGWIGWCERGHLIVALVPITFLGCTEPVDSPEGLCRKPYRQMPHQDELLAAYKLGGWDALHEAAQALIDGVTPTG